jgi:AraC family transcriptional regulator of adaptative response/methylated-DNA-[protein]-cysteine methyltransferase
MDRNDATAHTGTAACHGDPRWASILNRDASADGTFYYSVSTTGVYCRPSCGARLARPEHVQFHMTRADAEHAGFRPCKRCKPDQPWAGPGQHTKTVVHACRLIEQAVEMPTLGELAKQVGLSTYHFHRRFKRMTGLTPKEYADGHRWTRVRRSLTTSDTVTDAIYDAGFQSNSRFYETSNRLLGMAASVFRAGGADTEIFFAIGECSLGSILVAQSHKGVCAIALGDDPAALARELQDRFPNATFVGNDPAYESLVANVVGLIERPRIGLDLPLDIRGTAFQRRVWKALLDVPPGSKVSYAEIAKRIGMPTAVRAVGQACGANEVAVAIPCHRVVKTDGSLSGYRWGVARKQALLEREANVSPVLPKH